MSLFGRICITSWPKAIRASFDYVFATIKMRFYVRHDSNCFCVFGCFFHLYLLTVMSFHATSLFCYFRTVFFCSTPLPLNEMFKFTMWAYENVSVNSCHGGCHTWNSEQATSKPLWRPQSISTETLYLNPDLHKTLGEIDPWVHNGLFRRPNTHLLLDAFYWQYPNPTYARIPVK